MFHSHIWGQDEMDTLYWFFIQSKKREDVVGNIIDQIRETGGKIKSRMAVIQQLLQQDIICLAEYDELMKFEDKQYEKSMSSPTKSSLKQRGQSKKSDGSSSSFSDDITVRVHWIVMNGLLNLAN